VRHTLLKSLGEMQSGRSPFACGEAEDYAGDESPS
jgi:hypothetical protein